MKKTLSILKAIALAMVMCVIGLTAITLKYATMLTLHLVGAALPYAGRNEWIRTLKRALFRGERTASDLNINLSWSLRNLYSETLKTA